MGMCQSASAAAAASKPAKESAAAAEEEEEQALEEYELKKHRPGCNGMFWRSDPTGKTQLQSNDHWPRDGAKLRGIVVTDEYGDKWLQCKQVKQAGEDVWHTAPVGAAMPFEYEDHYYLG